MSLKWNFLIASSLLPIASLLAQTNIDTTNVKGLGSRVGVDTLTPGWRTSGVITINLTQVSLTNWAGGGESSISGISMFNGQANWQGEGRAWDNMLVLAFGGQQVIDGPVFKTEDRIELLSKYGVQLKHPWYLAALGQFRTQFTEGFDANGDRISHFLAPGYLLGAIGLDYRPSTNFSVFFSPASARLIMVQDETLWDVSDDPELRIYGVERGNTTEFEFGAFLRLQYTTELMKNLTFTTRGDLFSNYLRDPQNIKVNWETLWTLAVNEWLGVTLNTVLVYDHDIKLPRTDDEGNVSLAPRTQFKETLGIGLTLKL